MKNFDVLVTCRLHHVLSQLITNAHIANKARGQIIWQQATSPVGQWAFPSQNKSDVKCQSQYVARCQQSLLDTFVELYAVEVYRPLLSYAMVTGSNLTASILSLSIHLTSVFTALFTYLLLSPQPLNDVKTLSIFFLSVDAACDQKIKITVKSLANFSETPISSCNQVHLQKAWRMQTPLI